MESRIKKLKWPYGANITPQTVDAFLLGIHHGVRSVMGSAPIWIRQELKKGNDLEPLLKEMELRGLGEKDIRADIEEIARDIMTHFRWEQGENVKSH
jgi:hypothetical protein